MAGMTRTQIINRALGKIPAKGITAENDSSKSGREAALHYDPTLQLCLRRGLTPWNFATKRIQLAATNNVPVNEFAKEYELPGDCMAIQQIWPKGIRYRKEGGKLYTDDATIIIKYTSNEAISLPHLMEFDFMEYFCYSLAAEMAPTLSEDTAKVKELKQDAEVWFRHASSSFSMEDTPDEMDDGPWIESHEGVSSLYRMRNAGFDYDSLP
jgi:hypothetical protein